MMKTTKSMILPLGSSSGDDSDSRNERIITYRIRIFVLLFLCLQNSGHALVARYSQKTLQERYSTTEVVLVSELIKLAISTFAALNERNDQDQVNLRKLGYLILHSEKMVVLVFLYSINNILSYVALGKVDAALYTVLSQLKILATAGFMRLFFERSLSAAKWRALLLLVLGCILVASPVYHLPDKIRAAQQSQPETSKDYFINSIIGITVVLIMVANSGFASVYLESVLKKEKLSVWDRNFQLSFLSVILVLGVILSERVSNDTLYTPLFDGFTVNAYLLALIQALGGILVAAALKYADSILKTLATCLAIVVTAVSESLIMNAPMDIFVIIGCIATILAIANYSFDMTPDSY